MIVRDEADLLAACLDSVAGVADEVVVVDTGSVDGTQALARGRGATVVESPWQDSFAQARNVSLEHVGGDWVLWLDADERLHPADGPLLHELIADPALTALRVQMTHATGPDGTGVPFVSSLLRAWRHAPGVRFEGDVHEQLTGLLGGRVADAPVRVDHEGYRDDIAEAKGKRERNLALLERQAAADGGDPFTLFNLGSEHLLRGNPADAIAPLEDAHHTLGAGAPRAAYGPRLLLRLTRAHRLGGDPATGEAIAAAALPALPDHTDLAVERALCAADAGDPARGIALLDAALTLGDGPATYGSTTGLTGAVGAVLRGEMLVRAQRPDAAIAAFRAALAADSQYTAGIGRLAATLLATGSEPEAVLAELGPVAARHPLTAGVMLATALYERGANAAAEDLFAAALAAGATEARVGLAECALSRGDTVAAARACEPLPAGGPQAAALARCAVFCALVDEQRERAAAGLAAARRAGLPAPELDAYAAWLAALAGDPSAPLDAEAAHAALDALTTAIKLGRPAACDVLHGLVTASRLPDADARTAVAERFFAAGYHEIAADEWIASVERHGPTAPALLGLAQVALAAGELADAESLASEAVRLDPGADGARHLAERLRGLLAAA
jgi:tetratricopeptide (TPR) repeat protein